VADRIINSILQQEELVIIPWRFTWIIYASRLFLTTTAFDWINKTLGGFDVMSTFKGRSAQDKANALHTSQVKRDAEEK
jgi:hypothetical protein